jgi:hypothetical protein
VWRTIASAHPVNVRGLSSALALAAYFQQRAGVADGGVAWAGEAEALARELYAQIPDRHHDLLAYVLKHVWRTYEAAGHVEHALAATDEALRLARVAAERGPGGADNLRRALVNHATMHDLAGVPEQASAARDEATALDARSVPKVDA